MAAHSGNLANYAIPLCARGQWEGDPCGQDRAAQATGIAGASVERSGRDGFCGTAQEWLCCERGGGEQDHSFAVCRPCSPRSVSKDALQMTRMTTRGGNNL